MTSPTVELRRLAEARLRAKAAPMVAMSLEDSQKLLHELQVHQIELEMQSEELREAGLEKDRALNRYTQLYEFAPIGYYVMDRNGSITRANLEGASQLGLERSVLTGRTFLDFVAIKHRTRFRDCLEKTFETGDKQSCEVMVHVNELTLWLSVEASIGETAIDCLLAMSNITDRKQAEESLRVSETQYRTIIQTAQDGFWRLDKEGNLLEVNTSYCRMSGYSEQELLTMSIADLENIGPLNDTATQTQTQQLEKTGVVRFIAQHRRKDGGVFDVEVSKQYHSEDSGQFVVFLQDITERKALESQLRQSQKMESLGNLAGGIAHEFNNILAVMLGHAELTIKKLPADSAVNKHLQIIYKSVGRAAALVNQILIFSRKSEVSYQSINLSLLVRDALEMIRVSVPANIQINHNLPAECSAIKADNTQIHQIILNLCSNAAHAMGQSNGTIEVTVQEWNHCPPHLGLGDEKHLELRVQDSGQGISKADLENIFDPFFTTKDVGKGTGLGLSVVHGIVEKHHGKMVVESEQGKGTTFSIFLPVVQAVVPEAHSVEATAKKGQGHILIVDDQPELIYLYQTYLEEQGYSVSACSNGADALALFKSNYEQFGLVLTDQSLPLMTGKQLIPKLLEIRPNIPILLLTGYSELITADTSQELGIKECLKKPLSLPMLLKTIQKHLG